MLYKIDKLRIFRDTAESKSLSLGALGVLAIILLREKTDFEDLENSSPDDRGYIVNYLSELLNQGYISEFDNET